MDAIIGLAVILAPTLIVALVARSRGARLRQRNAELRSELVEARVDGKRYRRIVEARMPEVAEAERMRHEQTPSRRAGDGEGELDRPLAGDKGASRPKADKELAALIERADVPDELYVLDIETTGFSPSKSHICEIAAIRVVGGVPTDSFSTLVAIPGRMPAAAGRVNGITDAMLKGAPSLERSLRALIAFIGDDATLVGHNIDRFDIPFVEAAAERCDLDFTYGDSIDTLREAYGAWDGLDSYKMDDLRRMLGIDAEGAHRALKDCEDELLLYLAEVAASCGVERPRSLPFGSMTAHDASEVPEREAPGRAIPAPVDYVGGAHVAFTSGESVQVNEMTRDIRELGGIPQADVTGKTDYLVAFQRRETKAVRRARELAAGGQPIRVVTKDEFSALMTVSRMARDLDGRRDEAV